MNPFKSLSIVKENTGHFICRCPFCGDSNNKRHAHLYISKKYPVFKCFKCNAQGHISLIEKLLHEPCQYKYTNTIQYNLPNLDIPIILHEIDSLLENYAPYISPEELLYFKNRTHLKNISLTTIKKFSILPDIFIRDYLYKLDNNKYNILSPYSNDNKRLWSLRGLGSAVSGRNTINNNIIRYIIGEMNYPWTKFLNNDCYFIRSKVIQEYQKSRPPKNLLCCEGVYDCISLYLNRDRFKISDLDTIFIAVQGSDYRRAVKFYYTLYNTYPIIVKVFADLDRSPNILKNLFNKDINKYKIIINWPCIKDWDPICPIKYTINLN